MTRTIEFTRDDLTLVGNLFTPDGSAVNYRPAAGAYDYHLNEARGNVPEYRNETALMSLEELLDFDPVSQASRITTPTMAVHSDGCAFPDEARTFYEGLQARRSSSGVTATTSTTTTRRRRSTPSSRT
jgi:hypothetical protein